MSLMSMDYRKNSYDPLHIPTRGTGAPILYLDFDGVLHTHSCYVHPKHGPFVNPPHKLFEHAPVLERCLIPYPDIRIVLSTSWVNVKSFSYALKRLPPVLQARVIGATYHSSMEPKTFESIPRGQQVLEDVKRRQPSWWIALDDDTKDWPEAFITNLVATDGDLGLGNLDTAEVLRNRLDRKLKG
jgi:hypothetical protein